MPERTGVMTEGHCLSSSSEYAHSLYSKLELKLKLPLPHNCRQERFRTPDSGTDGFSFKVDASDVFHFEVDSGSGISVADCALGQVDGHATLDIQGLVGLDVLVLGNAVLKHQLNFQRGTGSFGRS